MAKIKSINETYWASRMSSNKKIVIKTKNGIEYWHIEFLEEIQKNMLSILKYTDNICKENNLSYFIDGGTLIGGLRHNGFIPWDDDIDISLLKTDYLKLINLISKNEDVISGKKYLFFSSEDNRHCSNYLALNCPLFLQISKRYLVPIKLDIRPMNVIKNTHQEIEKNRIYRDTANYIIFNKVRYSIQAVNDTIKHFGNPFNFMKYYNNEYGTEEANDTTLLTYPYYEYTIEDFYMNPKLIYPLKTHLFEDMEVNIPNTDEILRWIYKDYMSFPLLEERKPVAYRYLFLNEAESQIVHNVALKKKKQHINFIEMLKYGYIVYKYALM